MTTSRSAIAAAVLALAVPPALAQDSSTSPTGQATMMNADGGEVGTVEFAETPAGVLISAELTGMPPGEHGFHVHETGNCVPPFDSAGGHFNPGGTEHGFLAEGGPHAGDMPNIHVPDSGNLTVEVLNPNVSLADSAENTLFDDDGSALVVHSGSDDYASQPSGSAGERVACGVIE